MELKRKEKTVKKKFFNLFILIIICILFDEYSSRLSHYLKNPVYKDIYDKLKKDNFFREDNMKCDKLDPIFLMAERFKKLPRRICESKESKHICFHNSKYNNYNKIAKFKYGLICKMENIILDPLKSFQTQYIYNGPIDKIYKGFPILTKGFLSMKCEVFEKYRIFNKLYKNYFNSWNSKNEDNEGKYPELAPGKIIFFVSRNQDSPNLFHGISELINVICLMYLFNINPENIQIIFLESMNLRHDPLFYLYENLISRGGEPIYIRNLKQKYHISSAIYVPINWDSPLFIKLNIPKGYPDCKYSTQTYNIFDNLIAKYLRLPYFKDSFKSDGNIFYYPESVIHNSKLNNCFNISITIQWRKVWPKGRKFQQRILGNGPELADRLALALHKNYLIRLVDTASLSIMEQISIMKKTDYLIGVHGAGLSLSIFMPSHGILYEILPKRKNNLLLILSSLSGHLSFSDIISSKLTIINDNEIYSFDSKEFVSKSLKVIEKNHVYFYS